jgi:hypothetical protein
MCRIAIAALLVAGLLGASPAIAQDAKKDVPRPNPAMVLPAKDLGVNGKDDKPDPKVAKDRVLGAGKFVARVAEYEESEGKLKLVVPYRIAVLNTETVDQIAALQRELIAASVIPDLEERVAEVVRLRGEILQAQANLYTLEDHELEFEAFLNDDTIFRLSLAPKKFDEKGNIKRWTDRELRELRAPADQPGYKGERDDLRVNTWVFVSVLRKKSDPTAIRIPLVMVLGDVEQ